MNKQIPFTLVVLLLVLTGCNDDKNHQVAKNKSSSAPENIKASETVATDTSKPPVSDNPTGNEPVADDIWQNAEELAKVLKWHSEIRNDVGTAIFDRYMSLYDPIGTAQSQGYNTGKLNQRKLKQDFLQTVKGLGLENFGRLAKFTIEDHELVDKYNLRDADNAFLRIRVWRDLDTKHSIIKELHNLIDNLIVEQIK